MKSIYQIYESVILEAMSLEEIFKKFYDKDLENFDQFSRINEVDPTASKDKKGKYLDWLIRKAFKNNPKRFFEDKSKIKEDLALFDKNQRKIGKQISQIKDQYELSKAIDEFREKKEKGEIDLSRSEIKKQAEKIFEDSEYLIIVPKTEEAAKYYGAHTRWCTASETNNYFDYYNKQGPLYIVIDKKNNKKYQFHFQSEQYMNEEDEELNYNSEKEILSFSDKLLDKLMELANKHNSVVSFIERVFARNVILIKKIKDKYPKEYNKFSLTEDLYSDILDYNDIEGKNERIIQKIKAGADILYGDEYMYLRHLISGNNIEILKYVLNNIEFDLDKYNGILLKHAISKKNEESIKLLVKYGADVNYNEGYPLQTAASKGYFDIVKILIANGAGVRYKDFYAIDAAAYYMHYNIAVYLIEKFNVDIHFNDNILFIEAVENSDGDGDTGINKRLTFIEYLLSKDKMLVDKLEHRINWNSVANKILDFFKKIRKEKGLEL